MPNNKLTLIPRTRGVRAILRRVPVDGGHTYQPDGQEEFWFELTVDPDALRAMGYTAARNRNGRCVKGPFTVRIVERARLTGAAPETR